MNLNTILAVISVILLVAVFYYINWLVMNDYVRGNFKESFTSGSTYTVSQPLNVTYSCKNFCNPSTARCAISGQQCAADPDCTGCNPKINNKPTYSPPVPGASDSGKLTTAMPLNYSPLTFNYEDEKYISNKPVPQANFGTDTWKQQFLQENDFYQKRYGLQGIQGYEAQPTTTGLFSVEGPLPSNF